MPENARPFLQVGGFVVTLDPRAVAINPQAPQNLSSSHCSGWKSPGASTHLLFQQL